MCETKQIAVAYAQHLLDKLEKAATDDYTIETTISVVHLKWMCQQIIERVNEMSATKLHRWIGYIQGVMVVRGFTTVLQERTDYKEVKKKMLIGI